MPHQSVSEIHTQLYSNEGMCTVRVGSICTDTIMYNTRLAGDVTESEKMYKGKDGFMYVAHRSTQN